MAPAPNKTPTIDQHGHWKMERCQKDLPKDDVAVDELAVDELWEEGQPPNAVVLALMKILF